MVYSTPLYLKLRMENVGGGGTIVTTELWYGGEYNSHPMFIAPGSKRSMIFSKQDNMWVFLHQTFAQKFANASDPGRRPPMKGWSTYQDPVLGPRKVTITEMVSCELPTQIVFSQQTFGNMNFNSTIVGWVSEVDDYTVLLHPTSPFNRSSDWKLQSRDMVLGRAAIDESGTYTECLPPKTYTNPYNNTLVIGTCNYTAPTSILFTDPVTYPTTVLSGPLQTPSFYPLSDAKQSYAAYVEDLTTGGLTISPVIGTKPSIYNMRDIYNPNEDYGKTETQIAQLHVPKIGSIIVDMDANATNPPVYVVTHLVSTSKGPECVMVPINGTASQVDPVIKVTNDICMAFYVDNNDGPSMVSIDAKLIGLAENAASYRLLNSSNQIISALLSLDTVTYGTIPVIEIGGVKQFQSCFTNYALHDGDALNLQILDSQDYLISVIPLVAKSAYTLSDLQLPSSVIIDLEVFSNQQYNDGFYLTRNQNPNDLYLLPKLLYGDGSKEVLSLFTTSTGTFTIVDGSVILYNMNSVDTSEDGEDVYTLLFKYYIPRNAFLSDSVATGSDENGSFISRTYSLYILDSEPSAESGIAAVSLIPSTGTDLYLDMPSPSSEISALTQYYSVIAYMKDGSTPVILKSVNGVDPSLNVITSIHPRGARGANYAVTVGSYSTEFTVEASSQIDVVERYPYRHVFLISHGYFPPTLTIWLTIGVGGFLEIDDSGLIPNPAAFLNVFYNTHPKVPMYGGSYVTPTHFSLRLPDTNEDPERAFAKATGYIPLANFSNRSNMPLTSEGYAGFMNMRVHPGEQDIVIATMEFYNYSGGVYIPLYGVPVPCRIMSIFGS